MSNTYFKAMSVMGCEIGGITRRSLCRHNCCDGENCVTWLEKQFAKLNEYEEAKADGRLIRLPCKAKEIVYWVTNKFTRTKIIKCEVDEFIIDSSVYAVLNGAELWCRMRRIEAVGLSQFGKTIFLTREAAEKALTKGAEHHEV